jgi:hypothetical protein
MIPFDAKDIYAATEVDVSMEFRRAAKLQHGNQNSRLQKQQPALRDPGEDDFLSRSKNVFNWNPKGCEALISNCSEISFLRKPFGILM